MLWLWCCCIVMSLCVSVVCCVCLGWWFWYMFCWLFFCILVCSGRVVFCVVKRLSCGMRWWFSRLCSRLCWCWKLSWNWWLRCCWLRWKRKLILCWSSRSVSVSRRLLLFVRLSLFVELWKIVLKYSVRFVWRKSNRFVRWNFNVRFWLNSRLRKR